MFLKEFLINRYGPLPPAGRIKPARFSLFYGLNEEGKTLTIDALLKMLLGGRGAGRYFPGAKRVDENPEGYLVIETAAGEEKKLPGAGALTDLYALGSAEFGNIFVIRDSDLSIASEFAFYRGMTARLTGMRSSEIDTIRDNICDLGRITPGGEMRNTAPLKLKDRLQKALLLLQKIEPLSALLREEGFSRFEEKLAGCDDRIGAAKKTLDLYREAASRERYEKGREALDGLGAALEGMEELKDYRRSHLESWQRAGAALEHLNRGLLDLKKEIAAARHQHAAARAEEQAALEARRRAEEDLKAAAENIKPLLDRCDRQQVGLQRWQNITARPAFSAAIAASLLVMILSLAGAIFNPAPHFAIILIPAALLSAALALARFLVLYRESKIKGDEKAVLLRAERLSIPTGDLEALRAAYGRLENDLSAAAHALAEAGKEREWQQKEIARLDVRLEEVRLQAESEKEKIIALEKALAVDSPGKLRLKLEKKEELENESERLQSVLASHFGRGDGHLSPAQLISFWQDQVDELRGYAGAAPDLSYDRRAAADLEEKMEEIGREKSALLEKMKERSEELRDIEKELNELIGPDEEEYLSCQTTIELEEARRKLKAWIGSHEENRAAALLALEVFTVLQAEEEEKVSALFGAASPVSSFFEKITGGRYREVRFRGGENSLSVINDEGSAIEAFKLSGGAYDQLYFAIRLALGEKLLEGEKGFFILDDPFIKADPDRLQVLLAMLCQICASGWQILYFSAKGEIRAALAEQVASGAVTLFPVGSSDPSSNG